jgi:hypothetical protein
MPPRDRHAYPFADLLLRIGRAALENRQMDFLRDASAGREATVFYAGVLDLLDAPTVSIVGTRQVSDAEAAASGRRWLIAAGNDRSRIQYRCRAVASS